MATCNVSNRATCRKVNWGRAVAGAMVERAIDRALINAAQLVLAAEVRFPLVREGIKGLHAAYLWSPVQIPTTLGELFGVRSR